jgi:hypothetical protein
MSAGKSPDAHVFSMLRYRTIPMQREQRSYWTSYEWLKSTFLELFKFAELLPQFGYC